MRFFGSEMLLRKTSVWLELLGLPDIKDGTTFAKKASHGKRIFILGFCWTASSLLEEITRQKPTLLQDIQVVDFNPHVIEQLRRRGVSVIYGDISQRDMLLHAGVVNAEIIICTLPDILLKGASNFKLLRQLSRAKSDGKNHRPCRTTHSHPGPLQSRRGLRDRAAPARSR